MVCIVCLPIVLRVKEGCYRVGESEGPHLKATVSSVISDMVAIINPHLPSKSASNLLFTVPFIS